MEDEGTAFGELRSHLLGRPSRRAWVRLCEAIEAHEDDPRVLDYCRRHLERWDDGLRVTPRPWLEAVLRGRPPASLELVRCLDLSGMKLGLPEARRLAGFGGWPRMGALRARDNPALGVDGALTLLQMDALDGARQLDLSNCGLERDRLDALLAAPAIARLDMLHLGGNRLGDAGVEPLTRAPQVRGLRVLNLRSNFLYADGVWALARAELPALERLELQINWLGPDGARALSSLTDLPSLRSLDLSFNDLGHAGLLELLDWPLLPRLQRLSLSDNELDHRCASALATALPQLPDLQWLDLRDNPLTRPGIAQLREAAGDHVELWIQASDAR